MCYKQKCKVVSLNLAHHVEQRVSQVRLCARCWSQVTDSEVLVFIWNRQTAVKQCNRPSSTLLITTKSNQAIFILMCLPRPCLVPR